MLTKYLSRFVAVAIISMFASSMAVAGPFILAGTDADDHGNNTSGGTVNVDGWLFMQRALENLVAAPSLTTTNLVVANLGSEPSTQAANAAQSAFDNSTLPGLGWSFVNVNGDTDITAFFDGSGVWNINNVGIIMMDSAFNVAGGTSASELAIFTANATAIDNFLGAGGGLFSQSNGYGWVSALLPSLSTPDEFFTGIALTGDGNAAFPGLTDADLSAGPYHNRFENYGGLSVLGVSTSTDNAIIIGSSGGSVTNPQPPSGVPEISSIYLMLTGFAGLAAFRLRRRS